MQEDAKSFVSKLTGKSPDQDIISHKELTVQNPLFTSLSSQTDWTNTEIRGVVTKALATIFTRRRHTRGRQG